jgi:alpha-glucosidase
MITNTELEFKGDLYPSKIVSFKHDVDSVYFNSDNSVVLKVTVIRDSLIRFRYTKKDILVMISLMRLIKIMRMDNFLEVTGEEDYYQIQTSKVKCVIQKQI